MLQPRTSLSPLWRVTAMIGALAWAACSTAPDAPQRPRVVDTADAETSDDAIGPDEASEPDRVDGAADAEGSVPPASDAVVLPPDVLGKLTPTQIAALQGLSKDELAAMTEAELHAFLAQHAGPAAQGQNHDQSQTPSTIAILAQLLDTLVKANAAGDDAGQDATGADGLEDEFGEFGDEFELTTQEG